MADAIAAIVLFVVLVLALAAIAWELAHPESDKEFLARRERNRNGEW